MKKLLSGFLIGIIAGAVIFFFINKQWPVNALFSSGSETPVPDIISDDRSFSSVTSKLEKGGDLFVYLNTQKITDTIEKSLLTLKETIISSENTDADKKKETEKWFGFMHGFLKGSGLFDIAALGVSSRGVQEGLTRSRFVVQHSPGRDNGLIWNLTQKDPGNLDFIGILPENTVLASFVDFNYSMLWKWIKEQAEKSGDDKVRFGVGSVETDLKNLGIDLPAILKSINGNSGFLITLDRDRKIKIPNGGKNVEFPEPSIALVFETADDSIFKLLASRIPDAKIKEEKGTKTIEIKAPPMPFSFSPVILQSNNLLILASTPAIAGKLMNASEKSSLASSTEFKKLSAGIPLSGNGFTFMSAGFFREMMKIQTGLNPVGSGADDKGMEFLKKLGLDLDNLAMFRVTARTDEGYVLTSNSTIGTELLVMVPVVTAGGIVAAMAIPQAMKMKRGTVSPEEQSPTPPSREL